MTGIDARAAARGRHPSSRCPVPVSAVLARVCEALTRAGVHNADVAAVVLADRGLVGATPCAYARSLGIDAEVLAQAERGQLPFDQLPPQLQRVVVAWR